MGVNSSLEEVKFDDNSIPIDNFEKVLNLK